MFDIRTLVQYSCLQYVCDQNLEVLREEIGTQVVLTGLKSCKEDLLNPRPLYNSNVNKSSEVMLSEVKPPSSGVLRLPIRKDGTSTNIRLSGSKVQKDGRVTGACDEWAIKHAFSVSEPSVMLHRRFPVAFLDKAENFFADEA